MIKTRTAKFQIGQIVRHRIFSFRGVIFDIDPEFNNTEEWWLSIPEDVRPHKDQPFYHLLAENSESRIRRLRLRAKPVARRFGRADPAFAGRRDFREGQIGRLSAAEPVAELMRPWLCHCLTSFADASQRKRRPDPGAFLLSDIVSRPTSLPDWRAAPRLGRLQLLAGFLGALLQLFLQLLLVFLEHLRIGRRAVIGLGETVAGFPPAAAAGSAARRWS